MNLLTSHVFDNFNRRSRLDLNLCVYYNIINSITIAIVPINFINTNKDSLMFYVSI